MSCIRSLCAFEKKYREIQSSNKARATKSQSLSRGLWVFSKKPFKLGAKGVLTTQETTKGGVKSYETSRVAGWRSETGSMAVAAEGCWQRRSKRELHSGCFFETIWFPDMFFSTYDKQAKQTHLAKVLQSWKSWKLKVFYGSKKNDFNIRMDMSHYFKHISKLLNM